MSLHYYSFLVRGIFGAGIAIAATGTVHAIGVVDTIPTINQPKIRAIPRSTQGWLAQRGINNQTDFFEQGQEQFNREIIRLQQQPPASVLTVDVATDRWQPILSKTGNFSIWMPPGTLSQETRTIETAIGPLTFNVIASNSSNTRSVVASSNLPQSITAEPPNKVLSAVGNRLKSRTNYPTVSDRTISLKSYPGQELTFKGANETITIRYYLVNNRLYLIGTKYAGSTTSNITSTFLNSFQLTDH